MKALLPTILALAISTTVAAAADCTGQAAPISNSQKALFLDGGGIALLAKMNINIDGFGRAYHKDNVVGGGIIHLCNGGEVFLPSGARYHGSESNATCVGKFMSDYARIGAAGWKNPSVGAIRWYGVLGQEEVTINGNRVKGVVPTLQQDGSGFYVSPTKLFDPGIADESDQRRYINALTIPAAVIRETSALNDKGIRMGTFGVAAKKNGGEPVPFVVGDAGPRIGEGSVALARLVSGLPIKETITRAERFAGQIDDASVLWIFFGGDVLPPPYDAARVRAAAEMAFETWGGKSRLDKCRASPKVPTN